MSRIITQGNPASFTSAADVSDASTKEISYQWQVSGVDLEDGESVPTKSEIGSFFYSPDVSQIGSAFSSSSGAGTIGTKTAICPPSGTQGGGYNNSIKYEAPLFDTKYFSEFAVSGSSWDSASGWFGVMDQTHFTQGYQAWYSNVGVRMCVWFNQSFGFGEATGTRVEVGSQTSRRNIFNNPVDGDIIGVVVNSDVGAVNLYKNGVYLCTLRNGKQFSDTGRIGFTPLQVFIQNVVGGNSPSSKTLSCISQTTATSYASNYYFPSGSVSQDPSIGLSGDTVRISGSKTPTLTIESGQVDTYNLKCKVSHPRANNSPIFTDAVELDVVSSADKNFLNFEYYPINNGTQATIETVDLVDGVEYKITKNSNFQNIAFYAPDKDIEVELEMRGLPGNNLFLDNLYRNGGGGGYSIIRFTIERNVEYMIAGQSTGEFFLYKQSSLIAVVGNGGDAGPIGTGGGGGGVSNAGRRPGSAADGAGPGGAYIQPNQLGQNGITGSSTNQSRDIDPIASRVTGGRVVRCPIGNYWAQQGFSPCQNIGKVRYRHSNGTEVNNSSNEIERGWKSGTGGYRSTKGGALGGGGDGGSGATGGAGGVQGGGGGGSGYHSSDVTVVTSSLGTNGPIQLDSFVTLNPSSLVFKFFKPIIISGTFSHSFTNSNNLTTSLTFSGSINSIVSQGNDAADAFSNAGGNLGAKHYLITMNQPYADITFSDISNRTAGGGPPGGDPGIQLQHLIKINSNQFRAWFRRGNGFNTFIRSATITGIL
jgi:hypothetical protein